MAEKGNLSNSRLKRVSDMRWCVDYLILGGVSAMGAPLHTILRNFWVWRDMEGYGVGYGGAGMERPYSTVNRPLIGR